jgi:hypothetical protein
MAALQRLVERYWRENITWIVPFFLRSRYESKSVQSEWTRGTPERPNNFRPARRQSHCRLGNKHNGSSISNLWGSVFDWDCWGHNKITSFVSMAINFRIQQKQRIASGVLHTHGVHSTGLILPFNSILPQTLQVLLVACKVLSSHIVN